MEWLASSPQSVEISMDVSSYGYFTYYIFNKWTIELLYIHRHHILDIVMLPFHLEVQKLTSLAGLILLQYWQ